MVDVVEAPQRVRKVPKIYSGITVDQLLEVLSAIDRSLHINNPLQSVTTQQLENGINPNYFENEFAPDKSFYYYVDPFLAEANNTTELNVLSREEVIALYEDIVKKIDRGELGFKTAFGPENVELLDRIKNGLSNNKEQLETDSALFVETVALLKEGEEKEEEAGGVELGIPQRLKELIDRPFDLEESWPIVKQLAQDARNTALNLTTISTVIEGTPTILAVIQFRFFINDWLKKLYSDDFKLILESKRIVLPEMELFAATNKFFSYIDREEWNEQDLPVITFILTELSPVIDEFFKAKVIVRPKYEVASTESSEGESTVTDKKKPEELDDLLQKFEAAGRSYSQETERLTRVLLPTLFTMHGLQRPFEELSIIDNANFRLVEREFRAELENVLRSLSPEELSLLNQRGASLEFRLVVLRKLYGKLSTNPRFIGSLQQYKDAYVKYVQDKVDKREAPEKELLDLSKALNLSDEAFDKKLGESESKSKEDWSTNLTSGEGKVALQDFSGLNAVTQADLQILLSKLSDGGFSTEAYGTLFQNLDVILAERWSPEQIRGLSASDISAVLGIDLPSSITDDPQRYSLFINLCTEFLYARRQHLADHYELDVISRESGKPIDWASFQAAQDMANEHGAEALIVARSSDRHRLGQYQNDLTPHIRAIYNQTYEQRKKKLDDDNASNAEELKRFGSMSVSEKRELLASLGVLTGELDDVSASDQQRNLLLQQRYEEEMHRISQQNEADLDDFSYYEDQDDGFVQDSEGQRRTPQRYGQPGGKSLLKGALGLRKKALTAKKRLNQAKKALKAVDKVSDKIEAAITSPLLGPLAQNKTVRRGILAAAATLILDTLNLIQHGFFARVGAFLGGLGGGFIAGATGVGIPLVLPATLAGAWGGAHIGAAVDKFFGNPSIDLNIGGSRGSRMADALANQFGKGGGGGGVNLSGAIPAAGKGYSIGPMVYASGSFVATVFVAVSAIIASFQTPPLDTIGSNGLESPYVIISKTVIASPGNPGADTYFGDGKVPSELSYLITVQAKDDYQIEITNFNDKFSVITNKEKNNETPPALNCTNLTPASLEKKTITAADGPVTIGECTVPLNQSYHDSSILNEFNLQFKVTQNGEVLKNDSICADTNETFCASSGVPVCIGNCPAQQTACWPVKGTLTQNAYETGPKASHSVVDAYDIGARVGNPEYATFAGKAYAFDVDDPNPGNQGYVFPEAGGTSHIYGKHVFLVTDQGFVLLYGHMSRHGEIFQGRLNTPTPVKPGDILGYVGNSGYSSKYARGAMGPHLHYEYRVPQGDGTWHSHSPRPKDYLPGIVPRVDGKLFVYQDNLAVDTYGSAQCSSGSSSGGAGAAIVN